MHLLRCHRLIFGCIVEPPDNLLAGTDSRTVSDQVKVIAAVIDLDTQPAFNLAQMRVQLTTQIGQAGVIFRQ